MRLRSHASCLGWSYGSYGHCHRLPMALKGSELRSSPREQRTAEISGAFGHHDVDVDLGAIQELLHEHCEVHPGLALGLEHLRTLDFSRL